MNDGLPSRLGDMPLGGDLVRTEPGGSCDALIVFLGVYPAATAWKHFAVDGRRLKLPVSVEKTSFEAGSRSGRDLENLYLRPLDLTRKEVLLIDLWPYFMSNTRGTPTMADNVRRYESVTGHKTAVEERPKPDDLLLRVQASAANMERLQAGLGGDARRLVLTLGNEPAAFLRGLRRAEAAQALLYGPAEELHAAALSITATVVHLTHPGNSGATWRERHRVWCTKTGRDLVRLVRAGKLTSGTLR